MNKKHVLLALAAGLMLGAAYYAKVRRVPVVGPLAGKLPGADA